MSSSGPTAPMKTVDQFRSDYSRTGHVGAEADASYRFPVTSHGPMNVAFTRVRDFATSMIEDLQLLDRNHTVSFSLHYLSRSVLQSGNFHPVGAHKRTHWV